MSQTLRAIKAAEKIMTIITDLTDEEIGDALTKLGQAGATWGLLWGNPVDSRSYLDADFYEMKRDLLLKIREFRDHRHYPTVILVMGVLKSKGEIVGLDF